MDTEIVCELCHESHVNAGRFPKYGVKLCESCSMGLMPDFMLQRAMYINANLVIQPKRRPMHVIQGIMGALNGSFLFSKPTFMGMLRRFSGPSWSLGDSF